MGLSDMTTRAWLLRAVGRGFGAVILLIVLFMIGFTVYFNFFVSTLPQGSKAPEFLALDMQGQTIRSQDFAGQPLVMVFWSPNCKPCREELPHLQATYDGPGNHPRILTVAAMATRDEVQEFMDEFEITLPTIFDADSTLLELYSVPGFPMTYLIDQDGQISEGLPGAGNSGEESERAYSDSELCPTGNTCNIEGAQSEPAGFKSVGYRN